MHFLASNAISTTDKQQNRYRSCVTILLLKKKWKTTSFFQTEDDLKKNNATNKQIKSENNGCGTTPGNLVLSYFLTNYVHNLTKIHVTILSFPLFTWKIQRNFKIYKILLLYDDSSENIFSFFVVDRFVWNESCWGEKPSSDQHHSSGGRFRAGSFVIICKKMIFKCNKNWK